MKGFTLIETLIAITIVTVATAGSLTVASRVIVASQISRDKLTASYLAQEGIEHVRLMRDNEYLSAYQAGGGSVSSDAWNNFLTGNDDNSVTNCRASACSMESDMLQVSGHNQMAVCAPSGCDPIFLDKLAGGQYFYTTRPSASYVAKTPFVRSVQILDIAGTSDQAGAPYPEKKIVSTVTWSSHGLPFTISATENIKPWQ